MAKETGIQDLPLNVRLFFESFYKAVESKDETELNRLISDEFTGENIINKNKQELIQYIVNRPDLSFPFSKIKASAHFFQVDIDEENDGYEVIIKPIYIFNFLWIEIGRMKPTNTERLSARLERDKDTNLYTLVRMADADRC